MDIYNPVVKFHGSQTEFKNTHRALSNNGNLII